MRPLRDARVVAAALVMVASCTCVDPATLGGFECDGGVCQLPDAGGLFGGCGPWNCAGCCADDSCRPGVVSTACGSAGAACSTCGADAVCVGGACVVPDAGESDAGADDAGPSDAGPTDAGRSDAGRSDAGATDAGTSDAGKPDAGFDAGTFDAGSGLDAGKPDAGFDAGAPDAGSCLPTGASCPGGATTCCSGFCVGTCFSLAGDACSNASPLTFQADGGATVSGTTSLRVDDYATACDPSLAGPDVVYTFTTSAPQAFTATLTTTAAQPFEANLQLMGPGCASDGGVVVSCGAYENVAVPTGASFVGVPNLPAGTWYLVVDTSKGLTFTLKASLTALGPVIGDTCTVPEPMPVLGTSTLVNTDSASNDVSTNWCSDNGPDRVYSVTQSTPGALVVDATPTSPSDYLPSVTVLPSGCAGGTVAGLCKSATASGQALTVATGVLPSGTYDVVVDGVGTSSGESIVNVRRYAGESCVDPILIPPSATVFRTRGTLNATTNDNTPPGGCTLNSGLDVAYRFTLSATKNVWAEAVMANGNQAVLDLRQAGTGSPCAAPELACNANSQAHVGPILLPAGTYDLWVDSTTLTSPGNYDLIVSLDGSPSPGDTCANAIPVDLTPSSVHVEGAMVGSNGDYAFPCGGTNTDVVYKLTIPRSGPLTGTLTYSGSSGNFLFTLVQGTSCPSTLFGGSCTSGTIFSTTVVPGTAWLFIGGKNNRSYSDFSLKLTLP